MKLTKTKAKYRGWNITCHIGKRSITSWWEAPPDSCDHVGVGYLRDRYGCIITKRRAETFKRLFKELMKEAEQ